MKSIVVKRYRHLMSVHGDNEFNKAYITKEELFEYTSKIRQAAKINKVNIGISNALKSNGEFDFTSLKNSYHSYQLVCVLAFLGFMYALGRIAYSVKMLISSNASLQEPLFFFILLAFCFFTYVSYCFRLWRIRNISSGNAKAWLKSASYNIFEILPLPLNKTAKDFRFTFLKVKA